jgi:para-aminobenzoate synthetase component I
MSLLSKKITWQDPLELAQKISDNYGDKNWCVLYSGCNKEVKNSHSYIAIFPQKQLICDDFFAAEKILKNRSEKWFGYLSYELMQDFEKVVKTKKSFINIPKIWLINFAVIFEFNHDKKILRAIFSDKAKLDEALKYKALKPVKNQIKIKNIKSNFTNKSYLAAIFNIKKMIANGDFYQTNLTRKFFGEFSKKQNQKDGFQLFAELTKLSPANYSSFLKLDKNYIISSSPELFLKIEKNGKILSRPIKGTAARSLDKKQDQKNKLALKNSAKEQAENLMIVDLVRNDLSRVCKAGSVEVKNLFKINSYQHVHHMSSEIHGIIDKKFSTIDAVKASFPAGSMTGAPKIKAMEVIAKKEKIDRGIYSGAIGFFDNKSANLSVVIRTLVVNGKKFEFQVGGAITFDSNPKLELEEIFNKAKAISKLLSLKIGF